MNTDFIDIKGFEGLYAINSNGDIKSLDRVVICRNGDKKPVKSKLISPADNGTGYLFVYLWKNNKSYRKYVHRLVAETFIPNHKNLPEVNHKDRNKKNNNVTNLEWMSRLENEQYKEKHISGSTPKQVKQINEKTNEITIHKSIADCCKANKISCTKLYALLRTGKSFVINNNSYKFEYASLKILMSKN